MCGIDPEKFWELSFADICDVITAFQDRQKHRMQERAVMDYALAELIGAALYDPKRMPKTPMKAYPGLFRDNPKETDWKIIKANMKAFQAVNNARMRKAGDEIDH